MDKLTSRTRKRRVMAPADILRQALEATERDNTPDAGDSFAGVVTLPKANQDQLILHDKLMTGLLDAISDAALVVTDDTLSYQRGAVNALAKMDDMLLNVAGLAGSLGLDLKKVHEVRHTLRGLHNTHLGEAVLIEHQDSLEGVVPDNTNPGPAAAEVVSVAHDTNTASVNRPRDEEEE